jgi:hypothetical protein
VGKKNNAAGQEQQVMWEGRKTDWLELPDDDDTLVIS